MTAETIIIAINFAYIALMPIIFFKKDGRLNRRWWLTALPFAIAPLSVLALEYAPCRLAAVNPNLTMGYFLYGLSSPVSPLLRVAAVLSSLASLCLISITLASHRIPISLWHQVNDRPMQIVTWGPYKLIRHPFYAAFLLAFFAAFLFSPQPVTLICLIYELCLLDWTAAQEEKQLSRSTFGQEYRTYASTTGRFIPRLVRKSAA